MKFDEKEIENASVTFPNKAFPTSAVIKFDSPISARENARRNYTHTQEWIVSGRDVTWFTPRIIPDNVARASVMEAKRYTGEVGGKDMFGIEWEYVPSAHGSIVRPGNPTLTDITKWKEVIKFPDVDSWDWAGSAEENREYLKNAEKYQNVCIFTGYFERLISFMDFGPAAYALQNRKTQKYVTELFEKLTDLWIDIVDHCAKYYGKGFEGFCVHDDWGAQHSPFFNVKVVREMIVPHMKRLTDHIHSLGYNADLHSCGKLLGLVKCIEEAGWDEWDGMVINDFHDAYNNLTDHLIMRITCGDESINKMDDEEMKKTVTEFIDEFCRRDRPIILGNLSTTRPEVIFEIYRQSRQKLG